MTRRQLEVLCSVTADNMSGRWYRARSNGERVTLASLWRSGALERRARRGKEGEPDAAHEYARPVYVRRGVVK